MTRKPPEKDQEEGLFNLPDFSSVAISVAFQNVTSRERPLPRGAARMVEISETGLVLELPSNSCNVLHNVIFQIIRLDPENGDHPLLIEATGKVADIQQTDDRSFIRVEITLVQYEEAAWQELISISEKRQKAVNEFLRQARG